MRKMIISVAMVVALVAAVKVAVPTDAFDGEADKGFSIEIERPDAIVIEPPVQEEPVVEEPEIEEPVVEPVIEEPVVVVEPEEEPVVEPIPEEPAPEEQEIEVPEDIEEVTEPTSVPAPSKKEEPEEEEEVVHETVIVYDEPVYAPVEPAVEGEVLSSVVEVPETGDLLWVYIGAAALGFLVVINVIRKMVA